MAICKYETSSKRMNTVWHILTRLVVIALAAVWFMTVADSMACHNHTALFGHGDEGCSTTECVCACHAALESVENQHLFFPARNDCVAFDYIVLLGTSVPSDIFRPPLACS